MVIPKYFGMAAVLLLLCLGGCATRHEVEHASKSGASPLQQAQQLQAKQARNGQCPRGTMRVCDRRKSIGCRCGGMQNLKVLIGG